jgi:hypothetical protein
VSDKPDRTTDIGGLQFIYDVKSFTDYTVTLRDPRSDGAAIGSLFARHNLAFPKRAARVRMFHPPTPDRRTELMIIEGKPCRTIPRCLPPTTAFFWMRLLPKPQRSFSSTPAKA